MPPSSAASSARQASPNSAPPSTLANGPYLLTAGAVETSPTSTAASRTPANPTSSNARAATSRLRHGRGPTSKPKHPRLRSDAPPTTHPRPRHHPASSNPLPQSEQFLRHTAPPRAAVPAAGDCGVPPPVILLLRRAHHFATLNTNLLPNPIPTRLVPVATACSLSPRRRRLERSERDRGRQAGSLFLQYPRGHPEPSPTPAPPPRPQSPAHCCQPSNNPPGAARCASALGTYQLSTLNPQPPCELSARRVLFFSYVDAILHALRAYGCTLTRAAKLMEKKGTTANRWHREEGSNLRRPGRTSKNLASRLDLIQQAEHRRLRPRRLARSSSAPRAHLPQRTQLESASPRTDEPEPTPALDKFLAPSGAPKFVDGPDFLITPPRYHPTPAPPRPRDKTTEMRPRSRSPIAGASPRPNILFLFVILILNPPRHPLSHRSHLRAPPEMHSCKLHKSSTLPRAASPALNQRPKLPKFPSTLIQLRAYGGIIRRAGRPRHLLVPLRSVSHRRQSTNPLRTPRARRRLIPPTARGLPKTPLYSSFVILPSSCPASLPPPHCAGSPFQSLSPCRVFFRRDSSGPAPPLAVFAVTAGATAQEPVTVKMSIPAGAEV